MKRAPLGPEWDPDNILDQLARNENADEHQLRDVGMHAGLTVEQARAAVVAMSEHMSGVAAMRIAWRAAIRASEVKRKAVKSG